jgi:hypothetical protein
MNVKDEGVDCPSPALGHYVEWLFDECLQKASKKCMGLQRSTWLTRALQHTAYMRYTNDALVEEVEVTKAFLQLNLSFPSKSSSCRACSDVREAL